MRYLYYSLYICLVLVFASCIGVRSTTNSRGANVAHLYSFRTNSFIPDIYVYHISETQSKVFVKFSASSLLFNSANSDKQKRTQLLFNYRLLTASSPTTLIDSAQLERKIIYEEDNDDYVVSFLVNASYGQNYVLDFKVYDPVRKFLYNEYEFVIKINKFSSQNFLVRDENNNILFKPYLKHESKYVIEYGSTADTLLINYHRDSLPVAIQANYPFVQNYMPQESDSTQKVLYANKKQHVFTKKGRYNFSVDRSGVQGINLYLFDLGYPTTSNISSLINQLAYIATDNQLQKLRSTPYKKLELDNFWLQLAKDNKENARELIRVYYKRVQNANELFSSYKEGWKTDRGMIYIVYGPPEHLTKSPSKEVWSYGKGNRVLSFSFDKKHHTVTDNCYILDRKSITKSYWIDAMSSWRNGRVYSYSK